LCEKEEWRTGGHVREVGHEKHFGELLKNRRAVQSRVGVDFVPDAGPKSHWDRARIDSYNVHTQSIVKSAMEVVFALFEVAQPLPKTLHPSLERKMAE